MAATDKIYVTKKQFFILKKWYNKMDSNGLMPDYIPFNQYDLGIDNMDDDDTYPVWNLSVKETYRRPTERGV